MDVLGAFESVSDFLASEVEKQPGVLLLDCDGGAPGDYQGAVEDAERSYEIRNRDLLRRGVRGNHSLRD